MSRPFIFLLLWLILPTDFARAIPPPDLIISSTQAVFATLGLLASSLFISWSQVKTWLLINNKNKFIFILSIILILFSLYVLAVKFQKAQQASWQKTIDNEIAELWNEYESLYTAESEINVRANSLDRSHETTWSNFLKIVDGQDYLIVDIREGYGYEFGRVTDSIHIRFGDLINGDWQKLLSYKDKPIYIVCYVGSTGALTVNFLESKGFSKLYQPDGGVMKAVKTEKNYPFIGTLDAPGVSGNTNLISEGVFYDSIKDGAKIVDMRAPAHYENNLGLDISYQHFREFMTTKAIKMFVDNLNSNDKYVMLCDSELSCYQGEMLHEDLKRKKIESVGIYQL